MLKKYWQLFKISTAEILIYRARVILYFIIDSANFFVFPFIWLVIYGNNQIMSGYTKPDIITYYLVISIVSTMATSHISNDMRKDIMLGELSATLVRPINYIVHVTIQEMSYRLIYVIFELPLVLFLSLYFTKYFTHPIHVINWFFFGLALLFSFTISHCLEMFIGLASFWLGETNALHQVQATLTVIFSGQIAPLVFFPALLGSIAVMLPFKYMSYFPAQIYLGQLDTNDIIKNFLMSLAWITGMVLINYILWKRGLRRYEAAGI